MMPQKTPFLKKRALFILLFLLMKTAAYSSVNNSVVDDKNHKKISLTTKKLSLFIDYSKGCRISSMVVNGKNVLSASGAFTGISLKGDAFTSGQTSRLKVTTNTNGAIISGIIYGNKQLQINEVWTFKLLKESIEWDITRNYSTGATAEDMAFPKWNFANLTTWKAGILDNGGMVWCKYLSKVNDTYGVHTGGVTYYNAQTGDGLSIATTPGQSTNIATKFSHSDKGEFTSTQLVTPSPLQQRYDLSRFVSQKADVFAPFQIKKGTVSAHIELKYVDYFKEYSRGKLPGIDATAVRELLNTTGRYGVVDNNIVGANGWLTNWKCLHEPFFAQIGLALGDKNYTQNFTNTLNQERDQATLPDGRVLSRWHNEAGDEIPGTYNKKTGYYEAMWGYTVDSQTGYIINASEQFNLNGDKNWLKSHRQSCEKALDWLIKRDGNNNGIFEMMNNNVGEKKASDWLDIVWASYENAFVNAQMYEALNLWANCEKVLGNDQKSDYYSAVAKRLKTAFNKTIAEGGFWNAEKRQYVYWRDNDGSVHGDNLVTPVNFAAIAFGICDDPKRISLVLDQIEQRTKKENLFHWPLCFDSFTREEVSAGNWPFPKYENGDIFPSWGYLGVRAYAKYDKAIALKYINNLLTQYEKDGLSSQRYSRVTQLGLGDDVLSGICTSVTALYRDIYGIRPKWNRMGIEPNLSPNLNGTEFNYALRGITYHIKLNTGDYTIKFKGNSVNSKSSFGVQKTANGLTFYPGNKDDVYMQIAGKSGRPVNVTFGAWDEGQFSFTLNSFDNYSYTINGLSPGASYKLTIGQTTKTIKIKPDGSFTFKQSVGAPVNISFKKQA